jgi:hypothetical protein
VVTVTFANDTLASQLQTIGASLTSSAWWNEVRGGYCAGDGGTCIGDGPQGTSVVVNETPSASYTDSDNGGASSLQTWLASEFANGTFPAPTTRSNNVYVVYFPVGTGKTPATSITLDGMTSCQDGGFDGYHNYMAVDGQQIAYAVVMECPSPPGTIPGVPTISTLQNTTITTSHEVFESATDPLPPTGFALNLDLQNLNNWGWADIVGVEGADLCVDPFGLEQDETQDGAFTVQKIWSNARAAQGIDPCNPAPSGPYFNASPESSSFYVANIGEPFTVDVVAWSSGSIGDWNLVVQDWSASMQPYLDFAIAGSEDTEGGPQVTVHNGSHVQVTVTLLHDPGSLTYGEADGSIVSFSGDPEAPTAAHYWPFVVMSPADAADAGLPDSPVRRSGAPRVQAGPHVHRYGSSGRTAWRASLPL